MQFSLQFNCLIFYYSFRNYRKKSLLLSDSKCNSNVPGYGNTIVGYCNSNVGIFNSNVGKCNINVGYCNSGRFNIICLNAVNAIFLTNYLSDNKIDFFHNFLNVSCRLMQQKCR